MLQPDASTEALTSRDLSIYIPTDRRHALAQGNDLPDRTRGAALFADISGFTPLTEALTEALGPKRGAEELTQQLNAIYSALIAAVDRYRGSVIGFSGDAITCWFDEATSPDNTSLRAANRAVTCAWAMQDAMRPFANITTPTGAVVTLSIKVAVASGPARRFRVGDPAICYLDAVAGETLARIAQAEHLANRGEVVLSQEVIHELGDGVEITDWRAGEGQQPVRVGVVTALKQPAAANPWPQLPPNALSQDEIQAWLLPRIYERERTSQEQFLAELRPTVALFLRFEGIDYDHDPDAGEKLNAFVQHAQRIANRYEGTLVDLTIGDKGSYLYLSFGAPVAHDDDAMRAVASALELRTPPPELSAITGIQIGISMGRMRAGPIGGPTRRAYGVLGNEVNLSARLMSQAQPGQILISNRVAIAIGKRYTLRHIGSVSLKGKREPIDVWQVLGLKLSSTQQVITLFPTPLVGREAEWVYLTTLLEQARQGAGQLVRIEGAAGVGKSHLVAELAIEASLRGWAVSAGSCQSTTQDTAYAPWRQIFRVLMDLADANEVSPESTNQDIHTVATFVTKINPAWQLRLPLLGDLLGLPIPDNATTRNFEPKLRQSALFDLVIDIIEHLARTKPLLLVLDDAHWLDESSKGLVLAVARAMPQMPILLALVHRPLGHETELLPELNGLPHYHALSVGELTPVGVAALIGNKLGGNAGSLALSLIQSETQGNPFYVEEVVNTLREAGHLNQRDDGHWVLSEKVFKALQQANALARSGEDWVLAPNASLAAIDLGLPDSIQGVVLSRIDRLPEADKLTLKVAGVIGRTFALDLVAEVHPSRPGENAITQHAQHLEARDFTKLEATTPRLIYLFKHNVTRDVAYDTLLFEQRRQLHRAMAAAIETLAPEDVARIAHHAHEGEDWPRALRYQLEAGLQAKKLFANREGIEHLRKALHAAGLVATGDTGHQNAAHQNADQMLGLYQSLAEMLITVGDYDEGMANLRQAMTLGEAHADADAQARACRWMAYAHEFRSEFTDALTWIERGLGVLGERETPFSAELYAIAGLVANRLGNSERAESLCEKSIQIAEHLKLDAPLAFAFSSRALVSYAQGRTNEAVTFYQEAARLYESINNVQGQAMSLNGIGTTFQEMGRWDEAVLFLSRAREIFVATGDELHQAFADNNVGEILRQQGKLEQALLHYSSALASLQKLGGSKYVLAVLNMNLGATYVRQGSVEEAFNSLNSSERLFEASQAKDFLPELFGYKAEALLTAGNYAEALKMGEEALALARELKMQTEEGKSLRILGEIAFATGEITHARNFLRDALEILSTVGNAYPLARAQLASAKFYLQIKDHLACKKLLDECIPTFERLNAQLDLDAATELRTRLQRSRED